jgi:hypothetical protein
VIDEVEVADVQFEQSVSTSSDPMPAGPARVTDALLDGMAQAGLLERVEARLCLRRVDWKPGVSAWHDVHLAMVEQRIETWSDVQATIEAYKADVSATGAAALDAFLAPYSQSGVVVLETSDLAGCATVSAPLDVLSSILADDLLGSADVANPVEESDAGFSWTVDGDTIDGYELEDLLQTTPFYLDGYGGDERIGLIDSQDIYRRHVGFDDASGVDRIENCGSPSGGVCTNDNDPSFGAAHATAAAAVLLGDITQDQDTNITAGLDQRERSGVARTATALGIGTAAWENVLPLEPDIRLTARPGGGVPDELCTGDSNHAKEINALFESGVFMVWSAGNTGHVDPDTCRVRPAQTAIGAFTAGAYEVDSQDQEVVYADSARGGGGCGDCIGDPDVTKMENRTIIDVMGPSKMHHPYPHYDTVATCNPSFDYRTDWASNCTDESFCCTSSATAAVAGAASRFREWWLDDIGVAIAQPERMFTQMLLMGDRQGEGGVLSSGFDELWGAGKLRLRKYDIEGTDDPVILRWGNTCVAQGASVSIDLTGSTYSKVPAAADIVKVVAWWYDGRHDSGVEHDKIDLSVQYDNGGTWTEHGSSTTDDNRQRVFIDGPHNEEYRAVFTGRDVTASQQGCGTDSMMVWFAALIEDQARDDGANADEPLYVRPE